VETNTTVLETVLDQTCKDTADFEDAKGYDCIAWAKFDCDGESNGYTADAMEAVRSNCGVSCKLCTPAGTSSELEESDEAGDSGALIAATKGSFITATSLFMTGFVQLCMM
jgi:imidazole glycerol phosphate synthase subunit HisF